MRGSVSFMSTHSPTKLKGGKEMVRFNKWSAEQIIHWWVVNEPKMTFHKALDIFSNAVENYKNCDYKDKLYYVALCFITAANMMRLDFLTGSQAFEVANNVATDFGADKVRVQNQINKIMQDKEREYGKRFIF